MLNNLKKMINAEAESDLIVDLMLEATNNSIADMFIRDDGEIDMAEKDILDVLDKIPAYDEEAEMNKKLDKIAEFYIPEELKLDPIQESTESEEECLEEGLIKRDKHKVDKDGKVNVSIMISKNGNGFKAEGNIYDELVMAFPIPAPEKVLKGRKLKKYIRQDIETMFKDPKFSKYKIGKIKMVKGLAEAYEWEDDDVELESFDWEDNDMNNDYESYLESFESDYDYDDYLEEGIISWIKSVKQKRKADVVKNPKKFKAHVEKIKKNVMKDLKKTKDPEEAKRIVGNINQFIADDASFEQSNLNPEVEAMWNEYISWLKNTIIPEYNKIINGGSVAESFEAYLESLDDYDYDDYLEEGLFNKYRKMDIDALEAKIDELETQLYQTVEGEKDGYKKEYKKIKSELKEAKKALAKKQKKAGAPAAESFEAYLESLDDDYEYDDYLEEGLFGKYRKMSNEDLRAKIEELEAEGNEVEAGKYRKELDRRLHKDSKKEARAEKKAAKAEAKAAKKAAKRGEEVPAAESWEEYLESFEVEYDDDDDDEYEEYLESFVDDEYGYEEYLEEGLFGKHRKMSDADLRAKIDELELEGKESEARKYKKELERRMRKEEKKKAKEGVKVPGTQPANQVAESWEDYLESFNNDKE